MSAGPAPTSARRAPVFIVGAARSGTTLLQQMLDHHPSFAIPWESHFIIDFHMCLGRFGDLNDIRNREALIRAIGRYANVSWKEREDGEWIPGLNDNAARLAEIAPPTYAGVVDTIYGFFASQRGAPRWGDKTPGYVDSLHVLHSMFPAARFIHIIRDGRDCAASLIPMSFGPNTAYLAARKWRKCVQHGLNFAEKHPEAIYTIRYEDLIDQPEKYLREICTFVGEEFQPAMLDYHRDGLERVRLRPAAENIHTRIAQPPNKQRQGRWKKDLSVSQVRVFEAVAGELLQKLGYEISQPGAKLGPFDKQIGKIMHRVLVLRPNTKPSGLVERTIMLYHRVRFKMNPRNF